MSAQDLPVEGVGTDELETFLESDRSPPESMLLSDLDGFLTGIAIGPEMVMPSEWLPMVWGGEPPVFAGQREMQAVMGGIFSRYNEILRQVEDETFQPIFWAYSDGRVIAADWADGFLDAVSLRATAWEPLFGSEEHDGYLLFPILALCSDADGESVLDIDADAIDEMAAEAPDLIPLCVIDIAALWRDRREGGMAKRGVRSVHKASRNEPCPCGSGKKFKKCCGRAA